MKINLYKSYVIITLLLAVITGCGQTDGGLKDWQQPVPVIIVSNIQGSVVPPVITNPSMRGQFLPNSAQGSTVLIEEKPEFSATVDSDGKFIIRNVPVGKYHLVVEKVIGPSAYKQRSGQIHLTGEFETQNIPAPIQLVSAPHHIKLKVKNISSDAPIVGAKFKVWGRTYFSTGDGSTDIGPMPDGVWPVRVEAVGYNSGNLILGFEELRKAELEIKLTPLGQVDQNLAPAIEIEQGFKTIKTNEQGSLSAFGFDPDGDFIKYSWSATAGSFSQKEGGSTIYTAPPSSGTVKITLSGDDQNGGVVESVLSLDIIQGGALPHNPNNRPPLAPTSPTPLNAAKDLGKEVVLRWEAEDPDGDQLTYDVFFAPQGQELKLVVNDINERSHKLTQLGINQIYFWQVIARDPYGAISQTSDMWQFETGDQDNFSPYQPANPFPEDLATDQLENLILSWTGGDPDTNDVVTYHLYLGTDSANLSEVANTKATTYEVKELYLGKTYYWQIIAADNRGKETPSPVWRFSTYSPPNQPPSNPVLVVPASGSVNIAVDVMVRWSATDPEGNPLRYDVFLGDAFPLKKVGTNFDAPVYTSPEYLKYSTKYYVQVVVRDDEGLTNEESPIWSFTTADKTNLAPNVPEAVYPLDLATDIALKPVISWKGGDPDGDAVTYDFYLDIVGSVSMQLKAQNLTEERWSALADLDPGVKYYWKVVAKDTAGHETHSEIYSFTTYTNNDLTPPEIISVSPAHGELNVDPSKEVRIVFSEPMRQDTVAAGLSFSPDLPGAWTWENITTIRFWPQSSWEKGSYHRLIIASNTLRDEADKLLINGSEYEFTIKSDIPLPEDFRSVGYPIELSGGQSYKAEIPGIGSGKLAYAVAVSNGIQSDFTARGNVLNSLPKKLDAGSKIRELEKSVAGVPFPEIMTNKGLRASMLPQGAQVVGDIKDFYIPAAGGVATTTAFPNNVISAKCYGVTDNIYIFVDTAISNPSSTLISEVRKRFEEGIQPKVRDVFGNEPDMGPDGETRLTILMTDAMANGIAGIFYGVDLQANDPSDIRLRESNGTKLFYLTYSLENDIVRYGTMAHEFQHMVNYWQKRINGGSNTYEETWLNEGLSKYSEEVCGYGILDGDDNTARLLELSQNNFNNLSVTQWEGLNSYGLSYLFVRFIAQENRYGTTYREITRKLVQSAAVGKANIEAVTGEPFSRTLSRWCISLLLNEYQKLNPDGYGLSGLDLQGVHNGVALPGFQPTEIGVGGSVNVSLKSDGARFFKKVSDGVADTVLEFDNLSVPIKLWFLDQRP